jgi:hypothetical protein
MVEGLSDDRESSEPSQLFECAHEVVVSLDKRRTSGVDAAVEVKWILVEARVGCSAETLTMAEATTPIL